MVDWSSVGLDFLILIAEKIEFYEDFKAFGGVCKWWRKVVEIAQEPSASRPTPLLILGDDDGGQNRKLMFHDLNKRVTVEKQMSVFEPKPADGLIGDYSHYGYIHSSRGWLICIDVFKTRWNIVLVHPLSEKVIKTPNLLSMFTNHVKDMKFCLSDDPLTTINYTLVMNIPKFGGLGSWKSGDKAWNYNINCYPGFVDFIFYKGDFYMVERHGRVTAMSKSISLTSSRVVVDNYLWKPYDGSSASSEWYLVGSNTVLFQIERKFCSSNTSRTQSFTVWEVDIKSGVRRRVNNLRNKTFFIGGGNSSFCIDALHSENCKPNCIYYTDSKSSRRWGDDMGVFDLATEQIIEDLSVDPISSNFTSSFWVENSLMPSSRLDKG